MHFFLSFGRSFKQRTLKDINEKQAYSKEVFQVITHNKIKVFQVNTSLLQVTVFLTSACHKINFTTFYYILNHEYNFQKIILFESD